MASKEGSVHQQQMMILVPTRNYYFSKNLSSLPCARRLPGSCVPHARTRNTSELVLLHPVASDETRTKEERINRASSTRVGLLATKMILKFDGTRAKEKSDEEATTSRVFHFKTALVLIHVSISERHHAPRIYCNMMHAQSNLKRVTTIRSAIYTLDINFTFSHSIVLIFVSLDG